MKDGEGFVATELTRGPWSSLHQHGGPPAALLSRAVEAASDDTQVVRLTVEFLRPIPIDRLTISTQVVRRGRKVRWLSASLHHTSGEVARAAAVCIRRGSDSPITDHDEDRPGPASPHQASEAHFPFKDEIGYHKAVELRFASGGFGTGRSAAWMRMRYPLVAGEEPTPLQRVVLVADSGNGVSAAVDWRKWVFINPDLTVYLHRLPRGQWVCLDAITRLQNNGVGVAESSLWDQHGPIGRSVQSLLIDAANSL